jgi:peptide-methionine (S)-S-oxide reductase
VGYAGGEKIKPTYHDLGDHSETLQIDFDPERLSFEELLNLFWKARAPTGPARSRQYRSLLFYDDERQKRLAAASLEREKARHGRAIHTAVLPMTGFYQAEDYHQKYYLRQDRILMDEFRTFYPAVQDFVDSTAAARVNGYLAGYGTRTALLADLDILGLSPGGRKRLLDSTTSG